MAKVYVPHMPHKFDQSMQIHIPNVDTTQANKFGEVIILVDRNVPNTALMPIVEALKERLADFTEDDYLLPLGDPALTAAAAGIVLRKTGGRLKLLKWDRWAKDYVVVEMRI
jgi:hypothetical protein